MSTRIAVLILLLSGSISSVSAAKPLCINLTSVVVVNEHCGQADGEITLEHDGTAPFTYQWTHDVNLNDSIAQNLTQGTYTVKVIDAAGCEAETTLNLINTPPPSASLLSETDPSCFGGKDGTATIDADPANTISWNSSPTQSGLSLTGVGAGTYTATVRDSFGCETFIVVNLSQPDPIILTGSSFPDTCGAPNGQATVIVTSGAVGQLSYQWDASAGNQTGPTATGLSAGQYEVVVTDAIGCSRSINLTVASHENGFGGSVDISPPLCFGSEDGQVVFTGVGGNGNYSVDWINPSLAVLANGLTFNNVSAGAYQAIATDPLGDGCEVKINFFVSQPDSLETGYRLIEASGCRTPDATVYVLPIGGTPPYSTLWSTGQSTDTIRNLQPDIIQVSVTDGNGCVAEDMVVITSSTGPDFEIELLQADNCGLGDGIVRLNMQTGKSPFEIIWNTNPVQTSDTAFYAYDLRRTRSNGYSVIVIDDDSCISIQGFPVPGRKALSVEATSSTDEYCDLADGSVTASFMGGTPPYRYEWSTFPKQLSQTATGLIAGTYQVILRDSFNCSITSTVAIEKAEGFTLEVSAADESCYGTEDGSAQALVSGGRGPFQYLWDTNPPQTTALASNLGDGSYLVRVTDREGCERTSFGIVEAVDRVIAEFRVEPDSLGPVSLSESTFRFRNRSEGADEFLWTFGDGNSSTDFEPVHTYNDTGRYEVQLIAFNNFSQCSDTMALGPIQITLDGVIHVPNAFSPNRDGFNDDFYLRGQAIESLQFRVYGRWGGEVFASSAITDRWDGSLPNGSPAPEGVYVYVLEASLAGEKPFSQSGTIVLLR